MTSIMNLKSEEKKEKRGKGKEKDRNEAFGILRKKSVFGFVK